MKENMAERTAAQGAEAREDRGAAAVDLGKFKDVNALLNAYNSLEAEFTRRSQRLRELEEREQAGEQGVAPSPADAGAALAATVESAVEAYFAAHPPRVMAGGGTFAAAAPPRVCSLEEAGRLAREWMDQNVSQK